MAILTRRAIRVGLLLLGWLGACKDPGEPERVRVRTVTIAPVDAEIEVGNQLQLTATARDTLNNVIEDKSVEWTSENSTVATVSGAGLVTAQAAGTATIGAVVDGVIGTATIVVMPPQTIVVSDPSPSVQASRGGAIPGAAAAATTDVAFVSLAPGTVPDGQMAFITSPRITANIAVPMTDGGFDAVPVPALAGDEVTIEVEVAGGPARTVNAKVPTRRKPTVVRTVPPRGKTDVPTNAPAILVFSEPIDGVTLTSTDIRMFRGTEMIPGTAQLLEGTTTSVVFRPSAFLEPSLTYRIEIVGEIRDLDGDLVDKDTVTSFTAGATAVGVPNFVRVSPDTLAVEVGAQIQLVPTVFDIEGNPVVGHPVTWRSADPSLATVTVSGLVTAIANSSFEVKIFAEVAGAQAGYIVLIIGNLIPVSSVELMWESTTLVVGRTEYLPVTAWLENGERMGTGRLATWWSSNPAVVTVERGTSSYGELKAIGVGTAKVAVTIEGKSDTILVTVSASDVTAPTVAATTPGSGATGVARETEVSVTFSETIDDGSVTSSSITVTGSGPVTGQVYASLRTITFIPDQPLSFGANYTVHVAGSVRDLSGNSLGTDYVWTFRTADPVPLSDIAAIDLEFKSSCGVSSTGAVYCWGPGHTTAVPLLPSMTFRQLSNGLTHDCGITTEGTAYCWGTNDRGQLGDGTTTYRALPVPVAGGLTFVSVRAGWSHTCAHTATGTAYCWGDNATGAVGNPSVPSFTTVPIAVTGGLTFAMVSVGPGHTCGISVEDAPHCWGENLSGQLGDGTTTRRYSPVAVAGGRTFASVTLGWSFACGLTSEGAAYCWGSNNRGQLGIGTTSPSLTPEAVIGGLSFSSIAGGNNHTCALTTAGAAYCWGANGTGALGDGTTSNRSSPRAVVGNLSFSAIDVGDNHSCGVTPAGAVYCWGSNDVGQLGDGTRVNSSVPVRVLKGP